jgi:hypothetical protein
MSASNNDNNDRAGRIKNDGREERLSFRNFAEHQLRNEFKREAMEKCDLQVSAFAECSKEQGVMVVFRCREFQKEVQECMSVYHSNERWEIYKKEHEADMENKVPGKL